MNNTASTSTTGTDSSPSIVPADQLTSNGVSFQDLRVSILGDKPHIMQYCKSGRKPTTRDKQEYSAANAKFLDKLTATCRSLEKEFFEFNGGKLSLAPASAHGSLIVPASGMSGNTASLATFETQPGNGITLELGAVTLMDASPPSSAHLKDGNAGIQLKLGEANDADEPVETIIFSGRHGVVAWFHANLQNAEHESKMADDSGDEPDDYVGVQY